MIKTSITVQDACDVLNEALRLDPKAISNLVSCRVPCNSALAGHASIQVGSAEDINDDTEHVVGLLGVLNGLFGTFDEDPKEGWGPITAVVDEHVIKTFRPTER